MKLQQENCGWCLDYNSKSTGFIGDETPLIVQDKMMADLPKSEFKTFLLMNVYSRIKIL